jgi:DNA-binding HxlR family transcriptional regulator
MLKREYETQNCSVARTLELVGERWTLLIVRDAFLGVKRFDEFQRSLGVARNVLSDRLGRLVEAGILERRLYQERPERYEYTLTEKGRELRVALAALRQWGDQHLAPAGPPRLVEHAGCGGEAVATLVCGKCGKALGPDDISNRPGPGAISAAA